MSYIYRKRVEFLRIWIYVSKMMSHSDVESKQGHSTWLQAVQVLSSSLRVHRVEWLCCVASQRARWGTWRTLPRRGTVCRLWLVNSSSMILHWGLKVPRAVPHHLEMTSRSRCSLWCWSLSFCFVCCHPAFLAVQKGQLH